MKGEELKTDRMNCRPSVLQCSFVLVKPRLANTRLKLSHAALGETKTKSMKPEMSIIGPHLQTNKPKTEKLILVFKEMIVTCNLL